MVSVIMPTYNRADLIAASINSVLSQSYTDIELLIGDDGSDDNTKAIVQAVTDTRVRYYQLPRSGYISRVKNFLLQQATGDYIAFIDSDDMWKEDKLKKQLQLLTDRAAIGFSITDLTNFKEDIILSERFYPDHQGIECASIFDRMKENRFMVFPSTLVFRRQCLEKTGGFDETLQYAADFNFLIRLAYYFDAGIIYESLLWRRVHHSNRSNHFSIENYSGHISTFEYLYKHGMIKKKYLLQAKSQAFFRVGDLYLAKGDRAAARKNYRQSLAYDPFQPRCYWHWLKSWAGK